jgi:hypothetical protein
VNLEKVEAIRGWTTPKNVLEVRSFMGLVGYYKILRIFKDFTSNHFFPKEGFEV